jgi:hypothetical protein
LPYRELIQARILNIQKEKYKLELILFHFLFQKIQKEGQKKYQELLKEELVQ